MIQRNLFQNRNRTVLVVQWLGICLPMQGTWVRSLAWEDSTCPGASTEATTTEAQALWSPWSATREVTAMRSPHTTTREKAPLMATRRKPSRSNEDPLQPKINKYFKIIFKKSMTSVLIKKELGWGEIWTQRKEKAMWRWRQRLATSQGLPGANKCWRKKGLFLRVLGSSVGASPVAQQVKDPPAVQETRETQVRSLGWEDPLEEEMAATPVFLAGESHGWRSLAGYIVHGVAKSRTRLSVHVHTLPWKHLVFRRLASRVGWEYLSIASNHLAYGNLWQP